MKWWDAIPSDIQNEFVRIEMAFLAVGLDNALAYLLLVIDVWGRSPKKLTILFLLFLGFTPIRFSFGMF